MMQKIYRTSKFEDLLTVTHKIFAIEICAAHFGTFLSNVINWLVIKVLSVTMTPKMSMEEIFSEKRKQ